MTIRTAAVPALALSATLALAGCSGAGDASSQAPPSHAGSTSHESASQEAMPHDSASGHEDARDGGKAADLPAGVSSADVRFARMMIPHHQQAVEMSEKLLAKDDIDSRVRRLAEDIKAAQGPEIEKLQGWLEEWEVPEGDPSAQTGHGMAGMMTEEDLAELAEASGPEATVLFLEQMILHHEGAVEMAETQVEKGADPKALALAQSIIDAQETEIQKMKDLLKDL